MIELGTDVTFTVTDYGGVLLDGKASRYWRLNGVGALALRTLLDGGTSGAAAIAVCERYDTTADVVAADLAVLLSELRDAGLVRDAGPERDAAVVREAGGRTP
jgi:hypothetical protein